MLDPKLTSALRTHLARIERPVEITATLDDADASRELAALLEEVVGLHPQLRLSRAPAGSGERAPSFAVASEGAPARVRFAGVPGGHEFTSFVLALLQAGGVPPKLEPALALQIHGL